MSEEWEGKSGKLNRENKEATRRSKDDIVNRDASA